MFFSKNTDKSVSVGGSAVLQECERKCDQTRHLTQTTESQAKFSDFADKLSVLLSPVFATKPNKSHKRQREQGMWKRRTLQDADTDPDSDSDLD